MEENSKKRIADDLVSVISYIKTDIVTQYPTHRITSEYFLLSVLTKEESNAYRLIDKIMLSDSIASLKEYCVKYISEHMKKDAKLSEDTDWTLIYDDRFSEAIKNAFSKKNKPVNSADVLYQLFTTDDSIKSLFKLFGVTEVQIASVIQQKDITEDSNDEAPSVSNVPSTKEGYKKKKMSSFKYKKRGEKYTYNDVDKNLINLNDLAAAGNIDKVFYNDEVIQNIFEVLQKKYKNNVVLVGENGCGKTATVKHIANIIVDGQAPSPFARKRLMLLDFAKLLSNVGSAGNFESKIMSIISDAKKDGNYIFFVDNLQEILSDRYKYSPVDIEHILHTILDEKNIQFICTADYQCYKKCIESDSSFKRNLQTITLETPTIKKTINILNKIKWKIEKYHNVAFPDELIEKCVKLCKRYISNCVLPDTAIDAIDRIGSNIELSIKDSIEVAKIKQEIEDNQAEIGIYENKGYKDYDLYDSLTKKGIELQTKLSNIKKEERLNKKPIIVSEKDMENVISAMSGVPVSRLNTDELSKLKELNANIKKNVIGQDEAVDAVCNSIKKQKLGISNPNKPSVFLFAGSTGTGKTLLAKEIAKEVYGDEKHFIRLDMSEYSEKTSVTKLHGCFTPEMRVLMSDGTYKAIKDVRKGDKVITPFGHIREVNDCFEYDFKGILDTYDFHDSDGVIECTPNHKILIGKKPYGYHKENISFRYSDTVDVGDISVYPRYIDGIRDGHIGTAADFDVLTILYLCYGCVNKKDSTIVFAVKGTDTRIEERIKLALHDVGITQGISSCSYKGCHILKVVDSSMADKLGSSFGYSVKDKKINDDILLSDGHRAIVMELFNDGLIVSVTNRNIAEQIKLIMTMQSPTCDIVVRGGNSSLIHPCYGFKNDANLFVIGDNSYYYRTIKDKGYRYYDGKVYDLSINDDKCYIVNGMSVHNSSPGYVGYDKGGILTEAVKKNKYCVLLLDEIEKADGDVHNMFLQLFDEGRMTDNTGYVVDFKNVIIIMTSNVGAQEADNKGDGFGFNKRATTSIDVFKKALRKKFKPEFINRINNIVYFNKLGDKEIDEIIYLELEKLKKRLNNASYYLADDFIDDNLVSRIHSKIDSKKYGARSVIREIEREVEDRITNFILDNGIEKGHTFTKKEIFG